MTPAPLVRRVRWSVLALTLALLLLVAGGLLTGAAVPGRAAAASAVADAPPTSRLDALAATLRRTPLAVDPEMQWTLDRAEQRRLVRELRAARVPVLVAVLPLLREDESGGDGERVLQALQRRVGRNAVYVVADQDGRMDLASRGVPLNLSVPYRLMSPPFDERPTEQRVADPAPPGWTTVPGRLREILGYVARAEPGTPNGVIDDVEPLRDLPGHYRSNDDESSATLGAGVLGLIIGLVVGYGALAVVAVRRRTGRPTGRRRA